MFNIPSKYQDPKAYQKRPIKSSATVGVCRLARQNLYLVLFAQMFDDCDVLIICIVFTINATIYLSIRSVDEFKPSII